MICYQPSGHVAALTCPYHNWIYDFDGKLKSVAFRHGVRGQGGMPADFDLAEHSLVPLKVATIRGMIFGSFEPTVMPLEEFLGARLVTHVERTLNRPYRILGRCSQTMRCNWKLYAENSRDTYHPSLLHSFATMFKLNRLSAEGGIEMDEAGLHHLVFARRHTDNSSAEYDSAALRANEVGYALADPRLIEDWIEWDDGITNSIMTLFPCLNLQQSLNTVAVRQMVPRGSFESELFWTFSALPKMTNARPASACGRAICSGRQVSSRSKTGRSASSCRRRSAASASRPPSSKWVGGRSARHRRRARPKPRYAASGVPIAAS